MELETILKIAAITAGSLILLSNFVNLEDLLGSALKFVNRAAKPIPPAPEHPVSEDEQFLHIVDLWFQLRTSCEHYGLPKAITAIDKVFPLLNDKIEEDK